MSISEKSRESRARRQLAKLNYWLTKTPSRSWLRDYSRPGYMVLSSNYVVLGCCNREYQATLEQVEDFISQLQTGWRPKIGLSAEDREQNRKNLEYSRTCLKARFLGKDPPLSSNF